MSATSFDSFVSEALHLPVELRSRLASLLIDSIDHSDDEGRVSPAWSIEIARRARELDEGTVVPLTLDQFRERIEKRLA
jgi:putative addiction module component (TIGR02574 family)